MPIFIFIVGVRGSGKTTLINNYKNQDSAIRILKPSTTRSKRSEEDNEYHFVEEWFDDEYLWTIEVGSKKYGVHNEEISGLHSNDPCLCVFDPSAVETIKKLRTQYPGRVVTIGIDTICNTIIQKERVAGEENRLLSREEFLKQRDVVRNSDVVLSGDQEAVLGGLIAVIDCINGKGGVLVKRQIAPLLKANVLLEKADQSPSSASYDLCLGDDVWCQGKYITLCKKQPTLRIPPYTYAIVSCKEQAKLPSFVTARFDLKNSLFFRGVILSNGPQVDPGYHGALFCMLYNGSDNDVGITRGDQFSTIEFHRTCGLSDGYSGKYQKKFSLSDFIPSDVAVSKGGMILERTQEKIDYFEKEWKKYKSFNIFLIPLLITIVAALVPFLNSQYSASVEGVKEKREEIEAKLKSVESLETKLELLIKLNKLESLPGNQSTNKASDTDTTN